MYLNNLFISIPLLKYLHNEGFGVIKTTNNNIDIYIDLIKHKKKDIKNIIL